MSRPPIIFKNKGDFSKTFKFMERNLHGAYLNRLDYYGEMGVRALREATPKDTGYTANAWYYTIVTEEKWNRTSIVWSNAHVEKGWAKIAVLLQYGHGTRQGGYVQGVDYINPALQPIFDSIAKSAWEDITKN